jgi:o-succinylbenzoate---CoA ligase
MERVELAHLLGKTHDYPAPEGLHCFAPLDSAELAREVAAVAAGRATMFLCDQNWGHSEHDQLDAILAREPSRVDPEKGWLCVPTGGTSGSLRFARHDQDTLLAATKGFLKHFGLKRVNAVGVLPLHHVSGFMAWARCAFTGGRFVDWDWKRLEAGETPPDTGGKDWVMSLVPTQLHRIMGHPNVLEWLRTFKLVFVGGAPAWSSLLERAAAERLPIALTYGMTETAAMMTALKPRDFLAGKRNVGKPMPHVSVALSPSGALQIQGKSVFRGYYPDWTDSDIFLTEDLAEIDAKGSVNILGRRDSMIISGGKKIAPAEVEAALLASGFVADVAVLGMPDPEWGQRVVACMPEPLPEGAEPRLDALLRDSLASYKRPRRYVIVRPWPRNEQGKVNHEALRKAVLSERE